ncbi:unnamed protein product [Fusarium venenatum]|uniref:Uncharacterized protein n=1 Tax=Fusarium venenatum TaxID=56646 RepID=A0A2L2TXY3_9HYPO|nr:uncharacterized protein FVRRES_09733 [Fusarium venenatum]CEI69656.1 unnamed protein product [Fusarium venenatum]
MYIFLSYHLPHIPFISFARIFLSCYLSITSISLILHILSLTDSQSHLISSVSIIFHS